MIDRPVSDCMTRDVFAVSPDTALEAVARLFTRQHISGAPVIDGSGAVVGVVTTYDLIDPDRRHCDRVGGGAVLLSGGERRPVEVGPVRTTGLVSDVMTAFVRSVPDTTSLAEAVRLMLSDDIHRLIIVDEDGRIVGIFTSTDAMRSLVKS